MSCGIFNTAKAQFKYFPVKKFKLVLGVNKVPLMIYLFSSREAFNGLSVLTCLQYFPSKMTISGCSTCKPHSMATLHPHHSEPPHFIPYINHHHSVI